MKRKPKEPTERIHIRRSVYLALIARYEETGVPIVDLASRAIATHLAADAGHVTYTVSNGGGETGSRTEM